MAAELEPSGGSSSQQNSHDIHIKLLMLGDTGVGKTCLLVRYAYDSFSPTFITTIGIDFKIKHLDLDDVKVRCICMLGKMPAEGRVPAGRREAVETITDNKSTGPPVVIPLHDACAHCPPHPLSCPF